MDLQSHVPVVVLVRRQQAQHHVIRVAASRDPAGEPKGTTRCVGARTPRPGRGGSRPGPLAAPRTDTGQVESGRKERCRVRGAPRRRPPGAEAGRSTTRDTPGPHLHVKQLGRLVHPDGDCALTQGFAEHFFEGIPHLIHPTSRQSEEGPVSPGPRLAVTAPSPCTLPPECKGHRALGLVQNPALSRLSSSHDPSYVQSPVRNPVSGTRHPLLRAVPVVGAGLSHRLPASGATRAGMVTSALCKSLKGFDRRGRGGTLFTSTRASGVFPGKKGGREGALGKLLTSGPPKTVHSPAALRCMQWTTSRAQAEAPAHLPFSLLLSSREFLQSHIATASPLLRESGVRVAPATASARAPVLCAPS